MRKQRILKSRRSIGAFRGVAGERPQQWVLVNPSGSVKIEYVEPAPRPVTLEGKTIVLRWNLKHNGNHYLDRIGELLCEKVKDAKIVKLYEIDPSTNIVSGSLQESARIARVIADLEADIVIGAQGD